MTKTILGYEVASPEQQRKTALVILGVIGAMAIAGVVVLFLISHWEQSGRQQALATVVSFETKCRYVVRNISRRVSYYDHTGYIGCAEAQSVADANDNSLGSVQRLTTTAVEFLTPEGRQVRTSVALHGDVQISVGGQVEILYRTDNPTDAVEFNKIALFGKDSIAPATTTAPAAETVQVPETISKPVTPERRPSNSFSKTTNFWIGLSALLLMALAAFWLVRRVFRAIKWLVAGNQRGKSSQPDPTQVLAARMSAVTRPTTKGSFGRR